jgi:hypothetical protein
VSSCPDEGFAIVSIVADAGYSRISMRVVAAVTNAPSR